MIAKPNFRNIHILIADADTYLAQAVVSSLKAMGFLNISHVKTASEALSAVRLGTTSFLITEWDMRGTSGMDLVRFVRRSPESPNRTLPIIMLTGRGELPDVIAARDAGITEFVVKPFSVQTLYTRIEQMVDHPKSFVVSKNFVGPERRKPGVPPPGVEDRRVAKPIMAGTSRHALKGAQTDAPMIFAPDYGLKLALSLNRPLASLITPEVLHNAQKAIDALASESMRWVRDELEIMERAQASLEKLYNMQSFEQLKESALTIKSRAGTFGYRMASDVARLLYLFLSTDFLPTHPRHAVIIQKYIEVLKVIFAQNIKEREGLGAELYRELERLTALR